MDSPYEITRTTWRESAPAMAPLWREHWAEIAHYDDILLAPDHAAYERCEDAGALRVWVVRQGEAIVGYAIFFVRPHLHYAGTLYAHQDVLYVAPEHRARGLGPRLVRHCDQALAAEGVVVVAHHVKSKHPALQRVLERQGYEVQDVILTKRLDR
jgi:GNAT superfamily N-acetyltransferase